METSTASEMWQMWKLYTSLLEFYNNRPLKGADNQRNCQLSSWGKEWSLGLEGFLPGGSAATNLPALQGSSVQSLGG